MCSGSQLWWKGVDGDGEGDPLKKHEATPDHAPDMS
jgi:hypothetical protein